MTNTPTIAAGLTEAQRLRHHITMLAYKLDPRPEAENGPAAGYAWADRRATLEQMLTIATQGALLGVVVDLFERWFAPKGWRWDARYTEIAGNEYRCTIWNIDRSRQITRTGPTLAAALIAAMEEVKP